jgi:choline dehydrogenase
MHCILVIEAGPDYRSAKAPAEMRRPNHFPLMDRDRFARFWWSSKARMTTVQDPVGYQRGKGLGGCSAINAQVAIRGVPEDYDGWAADGCRGWSWQDVLPTFIRLESDLDFPEAPYHGRSGPTPIQRPPKSAWGQVDVALAEAATALGYGYSEDHNAPSSTGLSPAAHNSRDGTRYSTNDSHLDPARDGGNVTVLGDALVDRVLITKGRATGVRANADGDWREIEGKGVILCAGAIQSPAILMRSGIGPADHLSSLGISIVCDLPVGKGLNEHAAIDLDLPLRAAGSDADTAYALNCLVRFASGPAGAGRNDMGFGSFNFGGTSAADRLLGGIFATLFQSFSVGTVRLAGDDPTSDPVVNLNLLSDERDMLRMGDGVTRLLQIARRPEVISISDGATIGGVRCVDDLPRGDELDRWLLGRCISIGHPCGTARMGSETDQRSVLDSDCRVLGIEGLRVVDASSMPTTPRANNHLSCVMLAEHIAHRIAST